MTRRFAFSVPVLLLVLCLLATVARAESGDDAKQAAVQKHNSYVNLYNTLGSEPAHEYTSTLGSSEAYKADKPNFSVGSMRPYFMDKKIKAMDAALAFADKEPAMPEADKAVKALGPVLKRVMESMKEAAAYYNNKRYVDDAYAKGRELHKQIVPELAALQPLLEQFSAAVVHLEAQQKEDNLQALRAEGAVVRAAMVQVVYASQDVCEELNRQGVSSRNVLDLNMDEFRPSYTHLGAAIDALEKVMQDPAVPAKEGFRDMAVLQAYLSDAQAVRTNAAGIIERVQKREAVSKAELMNVISSKNTPEAVRRLTNALISRYNGLI